MSFVDYFMASFLYGFPYRYRSFTFLKTLAKSNGNHIAIAFKSEKERQHHNYAKMFQMVLHPHGIAPTLLKLDLWSTGAGFYSYYMIYPLRE